MLGPVGMLTHPARLNAAPTSKGLRKTDMARLPLLRRWTWWHALPRPGTLLHVGVVRIGFPTVVPVTVLRWRRLCFSLPALDVYRRRTRNDCGWIVVRRIIGIVGRAVVPKCRRANEEPEGNPTVMMVAAVMTAASSEGIGRNRHPQQERQGKHCCSSHFHFRSTSRAGNILAEALVSVSCKLLQKVNRFRML